MEASALPSNHESLAALQALRAWCESTGLSTRNYQSQDTLPGAFAVDTGRTTCIFRQCQIGFTWKRSGKPVLISGKMFSFRDHAFEARVDAAFPQQVWWADYVLLPL